MSTNSELKERLARLGSLRDVSRAPLTSEESVLLVLRRTGPLDKPVTVARRLVAAGLTLKQAHHSINQLAAVGRTVCAVGQMEDLGLFARQLAEMNVEVRRRSRQPGGAVDISAMRKRQGLSQREYGDLLGIDVRTLQKGNRAAIGRTLPRSASCACSLMHPRWLRTYSPNQCCSDCGYPRLLCNNRR